jgi:hypothetical protein
VVVATVPIAQCSYLYVAAIAPTSTAKLGYTSCMCAIPVLLVLVLLAGSYSNTSTDNMRKIDRSL